MLLLWLSKINMQAEKQVKLRSLTSVCHLADQKESRHHAATKPKIYPLGMNIISVMFYALFKPPDIIRQLLSSERKREV